MAKADIYGRDWARFPDLKDGSLVVADPGFDCIPAGTVCEVFDGPDGLYTPCRCGRHYLEGQADHRDETDAVVGFYPAPAGVPAGVRIGA